MYSNCRLYVLAPKSRASNQVCEAMAFGRCVLLSDNPRKRGGRGDAACYSGGGRRGEPAKRLIGLLDKDAEIAAARGDGAAAASRRIHWTGSSSARGVLLRDRWRKEGRAPAEGAGKEKCFSRRDGSDSLDRRRSGPVDRAVRGKERILKTRIAMDLVFRSVLVCGLAYAVAGCTTCRKSPPLEEAGEPYRVESEGKVPRSRRRM